MKEFTEKIAQAGIGLISVMARQAMESGDYVGFVDFIGQQACIDAPESTKRNLGDMYDEAVRLYRELPEEHKNYTTGRNGEL